MTMKINNNDPRMFATNGLTPSMDMGNTTIIFHNPIRIVLATFVIPNMEVIVSYPKLNVGVTLPKSSEAVCAAPEDKSVCKSR